MKVINLLFFLGACATPQQKYDPITTPLALKQDEFRSCYLESDSYLGRNKVEVGKISLAFTITKIGKVKNAKVASSEFKDANLHACLLDQLRRIEFPAPKDGKDLETVRFINIYPITNS